MRINTNMAALNSWRNMTSNNNNLQKSLEKLSSGFRINRAADDAAGLAVSEKMRAQIRGTNQAVKNAQDGVSLLQTAEGALTESHAMLQRMRELSVQSATSTLQDSDRALLQEEFSQLQSEITRIGNTTQFNGKGLLDGSAALGVTATNSTVASITGTGDTKVGTYTYGAATTATSGALWLGNTNTGTLASASATFTTTQDVSVNGKTYSVTGGSTTAQNLIDRVNADTATTGVAASFDTTGIKFTSSDVGSAGRVTVGTSIAAAAGFAVSANSTLDATDTTTALTDTGSDATISTFSNGLTGATYTASGNSVTITSGDATGLSFTVGDTNANTFSVTNNGTLSIQTGSQAGQSMGIGIADMRGAALGVSTLSISTQAGSSSSITAVDAAINTVSTQRAKLGAFQNRLEYTVSSLSATSENLSAAESRIRDVDMAAEMANFTKYQILGQASTAMLAQANQVTQGVLSLLR